MTQPGHVLADFVRAYWPRYVANSLERDLRPVVDAEALDETIPNAATPPAIADGATSDLLTQVTPILPLGGPDRGTTPDGD